MTKTNFEKPDVAFFVPSLEGGVGRVTAAVAEGLHAHDMAVEVWSAAPPGGYSEDLAKTLPVRHLGTGSVRSAFVPLLRALSNHAPKTLLSASFHANCMIILASLFVREKCRIVIAEHTSLDVGMTELSFFKRSLMRTLIRVLYPRADAHVAVSKGVREHMAAHGSIDASNIAVIPNPIISDELFEKSKEPVSHLFFQSGEPVLLFVGRLSKEKDVANLINAFVLVQKQVPSRLLIAGDGPEHAHLERIVKDERLQERVALLGHITNPYPYFAKSDMFVLSSKREGLPTALIEALAFGMKIVSTDCPSGPREILQDGAYGALVPVGDSAALAESIVATLRAPKEKVPESALAPYRAESAIDAYALLF